jgi:hypothetical protein
VSYHNVNCPKCGEFVVTPTRFIDDPERMLLLSLLAKSLKALKRVDAETAAEYAQKGTTSLSRETKTEVIEATHRILRSVPSLP